MSVLTFKNVTIDEHRMTVERGGKPVSLRRKEYEILMCIVKANGRPVSTSELIDRCWDEPVGINTLQVHIHQLRLKLGKGVLKTRYGFGYVLESV